MKQSSEASGDSSVSASEDFLPYDENVEPIAMEQEAAEYREQVAQEEKEDEILWSRFSGGEDVKNWFEMLFVIFVSLVDRKRFSGPLTSGKVAYTFAQSTLQNLNFQTCSCIELTTKSCLPRVSCKS